MNIHREIERVVSQANTLASALQAVATDDHADSIVHALTKVGELRSRCDFLGNVLAQQLIKPDSTRRSP